MPNDDLRHNLAKLFRQYGTKTFNGRTPESFTYADKVLKAFADVGGLLPIRCRCGQMHSVAWQPHPGICNPEPRANPCDGCDCEGSGEAITETPSESSQDKPDASGAQDTKQTP